MHAMLMTAVGGPEVLQPGEIPEPRIEHPNQVKVRLHAAGLNPVDTKLRARGLFFADALPAILGLDGTGEVVETGGAVTRFRPGDRVWFCNGGLGREPGCYAQYTLVDEDVAQPLPEGIDYPQAAAAPLVLITAWEALYDRACMEPDKTVLIHGAAGGVGHVAVQLAKLAGCRVLANVSDEAKAGFVRDLGADEVIRYRDQDLAGAVTELTGGRGADIVLDCVGPRVFRASIPLTAHYGDLVTLLDPGPDTEWKEARNRNLRIGFELMLTPLLQDLPGARAHQGDILRRCGEHLAQGSLRIEVSRTYPLVEAAQAHRDLEAGHTLGKRVLRID